ncbi:MAG TPA: glutamate synthase-related protein [Acetobacteraceae bacterium]|jgi:glutamate synthase domain-containing protein 2
MLGTAIIALVLASLFALYVHDRRQTQHTILRNYPVIGYFRYFAETLGEYMRQYQYLPDWAERPFNRLERAWVYRSAKGVSNLRSFGSENVPAFVFRNAAFPVLDEERRTWGGKPIGITEGPGACRPPFHPASFFNISGMSYGALSHAAVSALSRGAKLAGVWMATGEGGLARYHLEGGCDVIMQMGTAKYGVRDEHGKLSETRLQEIAAQEHVRAFEVKLARGAKPGKGGILPGIKVTPEIAGIRGIPVGQDSISPEPPPGHRQRARTRPVCGPRADRDGQAGRGEVRGRRGGFPRRLVQRLRAASGGLPRLYPGGWRRGRHRRR